VNIEQTDTFGNYLIHGIDEIVLPAPVSWWLAAPGWKVLGVIFILWILLLGMRRVRHWWRNRYRRVALKELARIQQQSGDRWHEVVAMLPYYLKVTALQAYPRSDVAALSGDAWAQFLDAHYSGPSFASGVGRKLLSVAYLPPSQWQLDEAQAAQLQSMTRQWIATHKGPEDV